MKKLVVSRIVQLCELKGITLNTLANLSGVTPSTIYSLVDNGRKDIGINTIKKVCDGLGITLLEFFNDKSFSEDDQL